MYQNQADQQSLADIKVDHVTQKESAFLNECADQLFAWDPTCWKNLEKEVTELSDLQHYVSNMMEHWDMIAPYWVGEDLEKNCHVKQ